MGTNNGTYVAEISRKNPTAIVLLVDGSGSTSRALPSGGTIAEKASAAINRLLMELATRATKGEEEIRDYYHIGVFVYDEPSGGQVVVKPAWTGALASKELVPISEIAKNPARIEQKMRTVDDGAGGTTQVPFKLPVWVEINPGGGTPMKEGLEKTKVLLEDWVKAHPDSYPPTVIHITDGEPTSGDPIPIAKEICALATSDGNVLVLNLHVSPTAANTITFPSALEGLDQYGAMLYEMSSELPDHMIPALAEAGFQTKPGAHGCVVNGEMIAIVQIMNIGTRPAQLQ